MFKRRVEDSGKCPVWRFAFRIFYAHIANVLIMLVAAMLVENLGLLHIQVSDGVTPVVVTIFSFLRCLYLRAELASGTKRSESDPLQT